MIPFNIQLISTEPHVIEKITKSGAVTKVDGTTFKVPASQARLLINRYKSQSFVNLPIVVLKYSGEPIGTYATVATSRSFFKQESASLEEAEVIAQKSAQKLETTIKEGLKDGGGLKHTSLQNLAFSGDGIIAYADKSLVLDNDQKFRTLEARRIIINIDRLETEGGRILRYATPLGTSIDCFVPNSALISATEYHERDKKVASFDQMCEKVTPSVAFFIRAVYEWSLHFDDTIFEKMPVAELLLHFGAPNLLALPTEVRAAAPTGFDMKNMIVWSLSFYSKAKNFDQMVKLQRVVSSLLQGRGGYVWKQDLNKKSIYKDLQVQQPQLLETKPKEEKQTIVA